MSPAAMKDSRARTPFNRVQPAMAFVAAHLDDDLPLSALSAQAGLSPFHLHRLFSALAGETPKQFTLRLRLSRGAAMLLGGDESVLDIALACGFQSHEAFTRAFRRHFRMTPREYRARGFAPDAGMVDSTLHTAIVEHAGPCVGLIHMRPDGRAPGHEMTYSVVKKDLAPQPVLLVRRRIKRSEIAATIGSVLPGIFQYAQQHGIALAGHPLTRYVDISAGVMTIEPAMRVVGSEQHAADTATRAAESTGTGVIEDTLPGGPAATTVHAGPYETLHEAYAALEMWIESNGFHAAGAPWESYITDPAEHPDTRDWKTEVSWPIR
jgi:AraC family transcriptional regulator